CVAKSSDLLKLSVVFESNESPSAKTINTKTVEVAHDDTGVTLVESPSFNPRMETAVDDSGIRRAGSVSDRSEVSGGFTPAVDAPGSPSASGIHFLQVGASSRSVV